MNQSDVRTRCTAKGHVGEFRLKWKAGFVPVRKVGTNGQLEDIEYFSDEKDAELAAWRTMNRIEQPVMLRAGDRVQAQRSKAEALFKQGKRIEVSHVGGERV